MAALCSNHLLYTESYHKRDVCTRNPARFLRLLSCRQGSQEPKDVAGCNKEAKKGRSLSQMIVDVAKIGKEVKDRLRPEKKGDLKDLLLMSLSFAVYVYISQQIVCAYFAWISIPTPSW